MSRGRRISKTVEAFIEDETIKNPNKPRGALAIELREKIDRLREPVPTEETLIKMISSIRNRPLDSQDKPWSVAASSQHNFPYDSTPTLLRLWKLCRSLDSHFTVREAKWAIHLSPMLPDIVSLLNFAQVYAARERVYKLMGEEFNSSDLDHVLTMSIYEYITQVILGNVWPGPNPDDVIRVRPPSCVQFTGDSIEAAEEAEFKAISAHRFVEGKPHREVIKEADDDRKTLPLIKESNLDDDIIWIYTYWVTELKDAPKWKTFSRQQAIDILNSLREWSSSFQLLKPKLSSILLDLLNAGQAEQLLSIITFEGFIPFDLLVKVGYFESDSLSDQPGNPEKIIKRMEHMNKKANQFFFRHPNHDFTKVVLEDYHERPHNKER